MGVNYQGVLPAFNRSSRIWLSTAKNRANDPVSLAGLLPGSACKGEQARRYGAHRAPETIC